MKSKIVLVLLSLMSAGVQAGVIKGKIKDAQTGEEIIGASVIVKEDPGKGTVTGLDGSFNLSVNRDKYTLVCSYVGYESQTIQLNNKTTVNIYLKVSANTLEEVVIKPNENPANAIIKKVIAYKNKNNPENISSFKYTSYNKMVYDVKTDGTTTKDSLNKKMKGSRLRNGN